MNHLESLFSKRDFHDLADIMWPNDEELKARMKVQAIRVDGDATLTPGNRGHHGPDFWLKVEDDICGEVIEVPEGQDVEEPQRLPRGLRNQSDSVVLKTMKLPSFGQNQIDQQTKWKEFVKHMKTLHLRIQNRRNREMQGNPNNQKQQPGWKETNSKLMKHYDELLSVLHRGVRVAQFNLRSAKIDIRRMFRSLKNAKANSTDNSQAKQQQLDQALDYAKVLSSRWWSTHYEWRVWRYLLNRLAGSGLWTTGVEDFPIFTASGRCVEGDCGFDMEESNGDEAPPPPP
jgi:hypothetical protein